MEREGEHQGEPRQLGRKILGWSDGVPLEFYDETHRPNHFMNFGEEIENVLGGEERIEYEDYLS